MIYDLKDLNGEIWKSIDGFEDYMISNKGRVKSFKCGKERILEPWISKSTGYFTVGLSKNKKVRPKSIHTLMYTYFIGLIPEGCVVHHINKTKNNYMENFQVMTKGEHTTITRTGAKHSEKSKQLISENYVGMSGKHHSEKSKQLISETKKEKFKSGELNYKGEKNPSSILKEQDIPKIRIDLDEGILTQKEIGIKFGVCRTTISQIKLRKQWKHI